MTSVAVTAHSGERELAARIAQATAERVPVSIVGGGTRRAMARPPQTGHEISAAALVGITLFEPSEMVIGARAGTPVRELTATLAEQGQMLPFEPADLRDLLGSSGEPTVGALAAVNNSGPRRIQAGACRDALIGLRFINGRGEILRTGGRVMKNVTGLDLVKLQAGSWGTLGVLTEATFKVLPRPESATTLVLQGLDDTAAVRALSAAVGSPFDISAAAHLPAMQGQPAKTLVRIEGFASSLRYRAGALQTLLATSGHADILPDDHAATLWRDVRDVRLLAEPRDAAIWRVSVRPSDAPALMANVTRACSTERHYFDWAGGLIWIALPPGGDAGAAMLRSGIALAGGGHATLVRARHELRISVDVFQPLSPAVAALQARIKATFDPAGIFNPGRMYAGV